MPTDDDYRRNPDPKRQWAEILAGKCGTKAKPVPKPKLHGPSAKLTGPLTLTFPLPPKELSPNHTHNAHWVKTNKAKRKYQEAVTLVCQITETPKLLLESARTQATFWFRTKARRDHDNAFASLKGLWDALVRFGVFKDDYGLRHEPIKIECDKENPRLEITIEELN